MFTKSKNYTKKVKNENTKKIIKHKKYIKNIKNKISKKKRKEGRKGVNLLIYLMLSSCLIESEVRTQDEQITFSDYWIYSNRGQSEHVLNDLVAHSGTLKAGPEIHFCQHSGQTIFWDGMPRLLSSKLRNKRVKMYNGNRLIRNIIKLAHWNLGNSKWENKLIEIEALVLELTPDLIFISEANMWDSVPDYQRNIPGYKLFVPQAMMKKHKYARIVLLAREGLDIKIHEELMHQDISMMWVSVKYSDRKINEDRGDI